MTAEREEPGTGGDRCAACGSAFECGAAVDACWCASVELSEETLADVACIYRGCLCPKCLKEIAGSMTKKGVSITSQE